MTAFLVSTIVGFLLGFVGSVPVAGPVAVLVLANGLRARYARGFRIALGAAVAEAMYAFLAFWGFSTFLTHYAWVEPASRALAAVVLIALGAKFVTWKIDEGDPPVEEAQPAGRKRNVFFGFTITALNPTLIATWSAVAATLFSTGLVEFRPWLAVPFAVAAGVGISCWFGLLLLLLRRYRSRFSTSTLEWFVRAMGIGIIGVGVWFCVRFIQYVVER